MNPRLRLLFIGLLSLTLLCLFWLALGPPEPTYLGKPLSVWLVDLDDQHPGPKFDQAQEAVRQIGTKGLPQIIGMLNTRTASGPEKMIKWAIAHHLTRRTYTEPDIKHRRAALYCYVLGPKARPAIPALIDLLNSNDSGVVTGGYIGAALGQIGPDAVVPPLVRILANSNANNRLAAVHALAGFPTEARLIVPELIHSLKDKSPFVRSSAARSLGEIAQQPAMAIPALVTNLSDADVQVRWCACLAIGKFKREAESAVPALRAALDDPAPEVRGMAAIALAQIKPDDAATIDLVMPTLIQEIEDIGGSNPPGFQYPVINALADCAPLAEAAVPALLKCFNASDGSIHQAVGDLLKKIDPDAAGQAGIK